MNTVSKEIALITQLNRETAEDKIKWKSRPAPSSLTTATDTKVFLFFETKYKDNSLVLFERRYKNFYREDEWEWNSTIVLGIMDRFENVIWEYSGTPALYDLFSTVSEQTSGIKNLINTLLD